MAAGAGRGGGAPGQTNGAPRFTLTEEEEDQHETVHLYSSPSPSQRPQAVFNLELDYSDDDALLDIEQYSSLRRVRCCGCDCTPLTRLCPCLPAGPPDWWYSYTRRQRRVLLAGGACLGLLTLVLLGLAVAAVVERAGGLHRAGGSGEGGVVPEGGPGWEDICGWSSWRLPKSIRPVMYNLSLDVQMEAPYLVDGTVAITLNVTQITRCLVLHASDMELHELRLGGADGPLGGHASMDPGTEQLRLEFSEALPTPTAVVFLKFSYSLKEGLSGFYRSTYRLSSDSSATEYSLATTQFEANSARTAFPCFDEPAFKAVYNMKIEAPAGMQVLFNTAPEQVHQHDEGSGMLAWHFAPTPPMSTYLVAFVVGRLSRVGSVVKGAAGPVNVSVWGTPDRVNNLAYASETAAAILPAYERMFGEPYALSKLDLVAIPDFSAGAMENWGLITYRETALLASNTSSILDLRYVNLVVAHEMAHLWFGDLVTMDYWGELWLNEGFASYLEFAGATEAHPELRFFETFYTSDVPYALAYDAKLNSHPLSVPPDNINSTDQIESFFDAVSYEKGGSMLRMLRAWANRNNHARPLPGLETEPGAAPATDKFLQGLQQYLAAHKYGTTTAPNLWSQLSAALGFDVAKAMAQWTYHQGYPLVSVEVDSERRVWLHQARFTLQGVQPCDPASPWWIPVAYTTSEQPMQRFWFELSACQSSAPVLTLPPGNDSWVKVNAGQYGFYRVQYTPELWSALATAATQSSSVRGAMNGMLLSSVDVAGLIEDSFALAEAGELAITPFLDLIKALPARPPQDYPAWASALSYLYKVQRLLAPSCLVDWEHYLGDGLLKAFLEQQAQGGSGSKGSRSGTNGLLFAFQPGAAGVPKQVQQDIGYRLLRPALLKAAGYFGNTAVKVDALNLMDQVERSGLALDADVRSAVYQTAVHTGDWEVYDQLREAYESAQDADERERCLVALGYAAQGSRIGATLNYTLTPNVRSQDVRTLVVTTAVWAGSGNVVSGSEWGSAAQTWDWLHGNYDALHAKLGGDDEASRRMGQIIEGVASLFSNTSMLAEVDAMAEMHKDKQSEGGYAERAKESISANARWVQRHAAEVCSWVSSERSGRRRRR